ncbi:hint-domain-containing protein [Daldinia loculata]|uniref:hint-domain-containing protein n=1 Tax=Daldinia loculata TaxID=103429 RepID=UPI0020C3C9F6|nr:hint-domain-containing protein [Daldinia loculata]KAI1644675.1 hint-domain-containing protein [Daldinia loculata]
MVRRQEFTPGMGEYSSEYSLEHSAQPTPSMAEDAALEIHALPSHDGLIVRVQPPNKPMDSKLQHIPCDIVLVIDISGSMQAPAPAKMVGDDGQPSSEHFGLSILDMVKHAARTILSTLDENDRLGIVTFSREARVVQKLLSMTPKNKKLTHKNIEAMRADSVTNLWHGIREGVNLFDGEQNTGRVPAVMILTDGLPNYMCPGQGYVHKIRSTWEALPATLHTFGFGYEIRSGLLKSIGEIGGGNYSFIPDAGMIGTVFVHAVAHLQTTYATGCTLELTSPKGTRLRTTAGQVIDRQEQEEADFNRLVIKLGNLQYGQSRDIYLESVDSQGCRTKFGSSVKEANITGELRYSRMRVAEFCVLAYGATSNSHVLSSPQIAYHQSRSMICEFLSSLFPLQSDGEYETRKEINPQRHQIVFQRLLDNIPARLFDDEYNRSLMADLVGNLPSGQVNLALSSQEYFSRWGCHYFFSLWNAHAKQLCNSFKDPGPLMYNQNSFFTKCRDALDKAFDTIPPPTQSCPRVATTGHLDMSRLNSSSAPCFTGSSKVTLASGRKVPVRSLRKGSHVRTPVGSRRVAAVVKTFVYRTAMCRIADLVITPWHPIRIDNLTAEWMFPANFLLGLEHAQVVIYSGAIYSVLLQPDCDAAAHALDIGGIWVVALGHGVVRGDDVRAHQFLGDYGKVVRSISTLAQGTDGVVLSGGVERRDSDGSVCGFKKYVL